MKRFQLLLMAVVMVLGFTAQISHASVYLESIFASGVDNLFEDQDRDALIDVDGNDQFSVGDVLIGWARLDDHSPIVGGVGPLNNHVYGIISQEVAAINPIGATFQVVFKPTTVAGLKLSDIVPGQSVPAAGMVAVFAGAAPYPNNLINTSPGDVTDMGVGGSYPAGPGNGTTNVWDYFSEIINGGSLAVVAGIGNAGGAVGLTGPTAALPDYWTGTQTSTGAALITGSLVPVPIIPLGVDIATFTAGLEILLNNCVGCDFAQVVAATETALLPDGAGGFVRHDLAITGGTVKGSAGATNVNEWASISPDKTFNNPGGFVTDADFVVHPECVPEPTTVLIWLGLLTIGTYVARRRG